MKVESELLTVSLEKGLTLGQIMANFKHVVIGDESATLGMLVFCI